MDKTGLTTRLSPRSLALLLLITAGAILVHGYHPYVEDAEIYVPGIKKVLNPTLYPQNQGFFASHAQLTLFPNLIAASARITHLPLDWVLLLWHFFSIFLLLLACWRLGRFAFRDPLASWAGVVLIAALLTLPVAGTMLYIMDQYLNPRNLAASAAIFAVVEVLRQKYWWAGLWLLFAAAVHPFMSVFALSYCVLLVAIRKYDAGSFLAIFSPLGFSFAPASPAYHQVALRRSSHYLLHWQWYEWLGALAPLALLGWFSRLARSRQLAQVDLICRALIAYELIYLGPAVILSLPRFEVIGRLQPMRSLYLLYILMFFLAGAFLGELVLKNHFWRWLTLFLPLCWGMYFAQRQLFPADPHIEWPGATPRNDWVAAFLWIRQNTPPEAYFVLDPDYMELPGEDFQGFRAIAERSRLADKVKDSGVVSMFPPIAEAWLEQVQAQDGWKNFKPDDFQRLHAKFGVNWIVVQQPGVTDLPCPYQNRTVRVCRLN